MAWVLFIFLGAGSGILMVPDIPTEMDCQILAQAARQQYKAVCFVDKNVRI